MDRDGFSPFSSRWILMASSFSREIQQDLQTKYGSSKGGHHCFRFATDNYNVHSFDSFYIQNNFIIPA
jgi:hypothetical protein